MKNISRFLILTYILMLGCHQAASAQAPSNFQFKKYQVNEGLSENTVNCITQDRKGFLWLGTKDGLNKFDGVNFTVYRNQSGKENSIGNNYIRSIMENGDTLLYIGTDDGMYIMNRISETFERLEDKLGIGKKIIGSVCKLLLSHDGKLWIATVKDGIFQYDPSTNNLDSISSAEYNLTNCAVWTVFEDKSGCVWVGSRAGLFQYNTGNGLLEPVNGITDFGNNSNMEILDIFEDEKGNLWLGTWSDGILFYNKQQKGAIAYCGPKNKEHYITHIRAFLQYDSTTLLVGADDGLYLFSTETRKATRIDSPYDKYSLGDQNVYSLFRDREGGIWVGTYFGGLNYLNTKMMVIENYFPSYKKGNLSGKAVSQFCEDKNGNLWIATEDGGLNYFNSRTKEFQQPINTSYHNIHPLMLVGDELWIGTFSRGLDIYNTRTKRMRNHQKSLNDTCTLDDNCIFSLYRTNAGDIYVGTTTGLNKYDPKHDRFIRIVSDSISFVYDIKEDSYRNLWIAMYGNGVAKLDQYSGKWKYYSCAQNQGKPIFNSKLTGIHIDNQKRLWFSSEGRGIFLYDYATDNFTNIAEKDGLPNNIVYGILDDQFGNIWVSSNKGLSSIPANMDLKRIKNYTQEDGLQSNEFNYKSSFKASDGKLYFGGINGFNCFYPQDLKTKINTIVPPVEITGLQILEHSDEAMQNNILHCINSGKPIRLKHYHSSLRISFVSLSYMAQSKNQYAYKLDGMDAKWNHIDNNRSVTYVNLSPGKYTFRVKASNNDNIWNETGTELTFEIMPPFWLSYPAKILYVLLLILSLYAVFFYLIRRSKHKQEQQLETYKTEQETRAFKSKIEFFTNIAHEIRTPVSLIQAPLEEIIHSGDGNRETRQNLSIIEKNSERLNVLINQLLDFRKMDAAEHIVNASKVDLTRHLTELYERFRKTAQSRNIDFRLILPPNPVEIVSDADALTKIIGNFLTNALKYTNNKICLELQVMDNGQLRISVTDNGQGIANDQKALIFDPFYQIPTSDMKNGTGIGLSLAKHLAEILGGDIEIQDNPTGGAIFIFTFRSLPEEQDKPPILQADNIATTEKNIPETSDDKSHVLIVEDNTDMLHFMENSLKAEYRTDTAKNAIIANGLIEAKSYDLIITDIMMPDINGIDFVKHLRENINYSHIPIILLSAKTDNHTKIEGLNAGADVFIEKPFSISYLKAQISSLLLNRRSIIDVFNRSPLASYAILTTNRNDQEFISRLNNEIDKNISESDFSIESLTDKLFISRSNLQRKLKSICGYTPGDYLRTYRLKKAAQLLLQEDARINEVAYNVGFSSPSYFTKCFIKQFGMLPKEFIRKHSKNTKSNN